ncbi:LPD28 domain-containing protein [Bifidobacterium mongoliense]|uniref:LPD28 domain-containing protein n=1 Tax=Bifidobacterium mongoliense TaxID=518643 RepID=UPI0030EB858A
MKTVTLYPQRIVLQDERHQEVRTIDVYEAASRVNTDNLPEGWHRYAWRDNGGDGHNDTFENWVCVNHMNDYISREDVSALLDEHGGMYFEYAETAPDEPPIEMPEGIYRR